MSSTGSMFAVGRHAATPPATTSSSTVLVIVHTKIRCAGQYRGGRCNFYMLDMAAEPVVWTCRRCGHVNDSRTGTWTP